MGESSVEDTEPSARWSLQVETSWTIHGRSDPLSVLRRRSRQSRVSQRPFDLLASFHSSRRWVSKLQVTFATSWRRTGARWRQIERARKVDVPCLVLKTRVLLACSLVVQAVLLITSANFLQEMRQNVKIICVKSPNLTHTFKVAF